MINLPDYYDNRLGFRFLLTMSSARIMDDLGNAVYLSGFSYYECDWEWDCFYIQHPIEAIYEEMRS